MTFRVFIVLLPLAAIGCGSPVSRFPKFPAQKGMLGTSALLADAMLISDSMRDTNIVDLLETRDLSRFVLDSVRVLMASKGYAVGTPELASMGMVMQRGEVFKVIEREAEREIPFDELPSRAPPLYVSGTYLGDETRMEALATVLRALVRLSPDDEAEHLVIEGSASLGQSLGVPTVMILMIGGYDVPAGRDVAEGAVSTRETVGPVGIRRVSQFTLEFYVLDTASGELIWHDRGHHKGGTVSRDKAVHIAAEIVDRLP